MSIDDGQRIGTATFPKGGPRGGCLVTLTSKNTRDECGKGDGETRQRGSVRRSCKDVDARKVPILIQQLAPHLDAFASVLCLSLRLETPKVRLLFGALKPFEGFRISHYRDPSALFDRQLSVCSRKATLLLKPLELFTLDKALDELHYEMKNRPEWVSTPADRDSPDSGIQRAVVNVARADSHTPYAVAYSGTSGC